jgi:hypothetical protein
MGNGHYIGNVFIPRKTISRSYTKHYTTKIVEKYSNEIVAIDGWSSTDRNYIYDFDHEIGRKIIFRMPRNGNSMFILDTKDGVIIPRMSFDVMGIDDDSREFYLKPIIKMLGFKDVDSLLSSALVYSEDGKLDYAKNVTPQYFPWIRELTYDYPDLTITLYTTYNGELEKSIIDIYGRYYFNVVVMDRLFGKSRVLLFMGYVNDIYGIIPPIKPAKHVIDGWRSRNTPLDLDINEWVRLTDSEWCGWTSESEYMLKELEDQLVKLLQLGVFESLATVISYSSNIFVTYIDFYVKKAGFDSNIFKYKIEHVVKQIQNLEVKEIIENVLNL